MSRIASLAALTAVVLLSACGRSDPPAADGSGPVASCATKLPRGTKDYVLEVNIPSDSDPAAEIQTPTTHIAYTVMLPERCPGETFPVIVQSHGYSGTRLKTIDADGVVSATAHFPQINELVQSLPYRGYVVMSYDERGHGDSKPDNGGAYARIIDPEAEVRDASAILDWMWDNATTGGKGAEQLPVQTEHQRTGIAKDLRIGTIGYSYGGGFEMTLAALDPRIDTIVPNGTWHSLLYSLLPGDATKNGFGGLLCLLAIQGGVANTPLIASTCNLLGPTNLNANNIRTIEDFAAAGADPMNPAVNGNPAGQGGRAFTKDEALGFFFGRGSAYFQQLQEQRRPYPGQGKAFKLRPVPALFVQGNRDTLFNLTEAYWNRAYFRAAGADVRLLSTEGGHMNPFANQKEGSVNCGAIDGVAAINAWFDKQLKGLDSPAYRALPSVCISIADTPGFNEVPAGAGVTLSDVPVGSLSGSGAVPAVLANGAINVTPANVGANPAFVKIADIAEDGLVMAGIPSLASLEVAAGTPGSAVTPVAYVGVGIRRGTETILVDDEVTPFVEGLHTNNRNSGTVTNNRVLLPGIGERLQNGDAVGLVFFCGHVQYSSVIATSSASGIGLAANFDPRLSPPPGAGAPNLTVCGNNYAVTLTDAQLPIFRPGSYPGSALALP